MLLTSHPRRALAMTLLTLTACGHSETFVTGTPPGEEGPLLAGAPTRLTYSDGVDLVSSFSPDGKSLLFSFQPFKPLPPVVLSRPDVDRCIGIMPASGGTRNELCRLNTAGLDSTDAFEHAAVGGDGSLLYGAYASTVGALIVNTGALRLGTLAAPYPGRVLLATPTVTAGLSFDHFGVIRWASPTTFFVEVHDQTVFGNPLNEVKSDTFALGVGILRGDISGNGAVFTAVAGTDSASGFDLSTAGDSLYFTRLDDVRLYSVPVAGGTRRVVYTEPNVPARRIVRDPVRIGGRIALVAQNYQQRNTIKWPDPPLGLAPGSTIKLVGPGDGVVSSLVATTGDYYTLGALAAFGAMAASPDGCRLIVEHRIVQKFSFTTDLYSYCLGNNGSCTCS
ncbi:MAG: hypothetical protein V4558_01650 [Gemmatimonadota bacterium]